MYVKFQKNYLFKTFYKRKTVKIQQSKFSTTFRVRFENRLEPDVPEFQEKQSSSSS